MRTWLLRCLWFVVLSVSLASCGANVVPVSTLPAPVFPVCNRSGDIWIAQALPFFSVGDRLSVFHLNCDSNGVLVSAVIGSNRFDVRKALVTRLVSLGAEQNTAGGWSVRVGGSDLDVAIVDISSMPHVDTDPYEPVYGATPGAWKSYPGAVEVTIKSS
jgi:hypothetical protein